MYWGKSLVSELAKEVQKKHSSRILKFRDGVVKVPRIARKRLATIVVSSLFEVDVLIMGESRWVASSTSAEARLRWEARPEGSREMMGRAISKRTMPIQSGSQSEMDMVPEARAGPSCDAEIDETAFIKPKKVARTM